MSEPLEGQRLVDAVRHEIALAGKTSASDADVLAALQTINASTDVAAGVGTAADGVATGAADISQTVQQLTDIRRELSGLGRLTEVFMDPAVTDVVVNPDGSVWTDAGDGMSKAVLALPPTEVAQTAVRLATKCGVRLDDSQPFADGILDELPAEIPADALRFHAVLSPPAQGGACISIRALRADGFGLDDLCAAGVMPENVRDVLRGLVLARKNLLITGGTGTGKTTLLAALLAEVPARERMILVEDTPELLPRHEHVISLTAKQGNADGAGAVSMTTLLRQCLRMRPDRIIVGEIRGAEVVDLLVALNTGHAGSAGTLHANSAEAVPGRLMALGSAAGSNAAGVAKQAADGIDVVIHLERTEAMVRRVATIAVTNGAVGDELQLTPIWHHGPLAGWDSFVEQVAPC